VFVLVAVLVAPTLFTLTRIRADTIDHVSARGGADRRRGDNPSRWMALWGDRALVVFLLCAVLFHFANAAMLPLLGEMLAKGQGRSSMPFMAACVVTTQMVVTVLAPWSARKASAWGRKPLLLLGFGVLPLRGLLYTLISHPGWLISIQLLDGVGAGIFGVVSVLVIADLTRGTGRFNLTLGAITTAVGVGAALSQLIAGALAHRLGANASPASRRRPSCCSGHACRRH
jgi:MFS family permease